MIEKKLAPSLEKIKSLSELSFFTLDLDHDLLNGKSIELKKSENGYSAKVLYQPVEEVDVEILGSLLPDLIALRNANSDYYLPKNSLLFNSTVPIFDKQDVTLYEISGCITQISSADNDAVFDGKFLRLLVPIGNSRTKLSEIQRFYYNCDINVGNRDLIEVNIKDCECHFWGFTFNEVKYLVVDTLIPFSIEQFRNLSHSILNGFGFLFGDLFLDEGYILSSSDRDFSMIQDVQFSTYRESMLTGMSIYTTNPYSVLQMAGRNKKEREKRKQEIKNWYNKIKQINSDIFSSLCELLYTCEPISRAAIITLQGNLLALELKGSAYSAALEAITAVIIRKYKAKVPKPIDNKITLKDFRVRVFEIVDDLFPESDPTNEITRKILSDRINSINNPTNATKLKTSFDLVGYDLNDYEFEALKARDKFQHGELPVSPITDDKVFKEVYYVCIIMHRLIYVLVLKYIKFQGYLKNFPQIHSHITGKDLGESEFTYI